jgi:hypothetical protein
MNHNRQIFVAERFVKQVAEFGLRSDQMDTDGQSLASENGTANLRFRSFVGADCVKHDVYKHGHEKLLGSFLNVDDGAALVFAALGASLVGQLLFVARGALGDAYGG